MLYYLSGFAFRTITAGNTQVRRLGYLTAISQVVPSSTPNMDSIIYNLLNWAAENQEYLTEYAKERDGQGAINPELPSGARRYLSIADRLQLIAKTGDRLVLSRFGHLLRILNSLAKTRNPFFLSHAEILFYTYWLLLTDADFLLLIIDAASRSEELRLADMQSQFQDYFVRRLEAKLDSVTDSNGRQNMIEAVQRARDNWRKPERYAEHIVPTRASWLLDLGLLDSNEFKKNRYVLRRQGAHLRDALRIIPSTDLRDVTGDWLWEQGFSTIDEALRITSSKIYWKSISDQQRLTLLEKPMKEAYEHFHLLGMQACSMLPALIYCVIVLTVNHNVRVDMADLATWIEKFGENVRLPYKIRQSPLETDSYIYKTPQN